MYNYIIKIWVEILCECKNTNEFGVLYNRMKYDTGDKRTDLDKTEQNRTEHELSYFRLYASKMF